MRRSWFGFRPRTFPSTLVMLAYLLAPIGEWIESRRRERLNVFTAGVLRAGTSDAWKEFSMLLCDIASLSRLSIRLSFVRYFNKPTNRLVRTLKRENYTTCFVQSRPHQRLFRLCSKLLNPTDGGKLEHNPDTSGFSHVNFGLNAEQASIASPG